MWAEDGLSGGTVFANGIEKVLALADGVYRNWNLLSTSRLARVHKHNKISVEKIARFTVSLDSILPRGAPSPARCIDAASTLDKIKILRSVSAVRTRPLRSVRFATPTLQPTNAACAGEVRLTDRELVTAPPHRVDHETVNDRAGGGGGGGSGTGYVQGNATLFRYSGGRAGGIGAGPATGPPALLALAVQLSWPEDPATPEGRLVQTLQGEKGSLSTRIKALKVLAGCVFF